MTTTPTQQRSMSLLTSLFDDAVRSDYGLAATDPRHPWRIPRAAVGLAVVLGLVGLLFATAVLTTRAQESTTAAERELLLDRIAIAQSDNVRIDGEIAARSESITRLSDAVLPASVAGRALVERLAASEVAAGYTPVTGEGVVLTLMDNAGAGAVGKVMDRDLQGVTNGLWAAGATAIAINGIRLSATTAIRSAGEAILVDYRPLTIPYVVTAIGTPDLRETFADSPEGDVLRTLRQEYGIDWTLDSGPVELASSTGELPHLAMSLGELS